MKNTTKFISITLFLSIVFISCEKYEHKTYYDAVGEGYVFMCDSVGNILYPIEGAEISVQPFFNNNPNWFEIHPDIEWYHSDANGRFQVPFLKRTKRQDVAMYILHIAYSPENAIRVSANEFEINVNDIKNIQKKTILFDTIKFDISEYRYK
jgi:hypothetical protein